MTRRKKRGVRLLALPVFAFLLATFIAPSPPPPFDGAPIARLRAEPVTLHPDDPDRVRVGSLRFRRGWSLESDDRRFGGISAMAVEGESVTALSDTGILFRFRLPAGPVQDMEVRPLPQRRGEPKSAHDSEALWVEGDTAWVAFERTNRIARYDRRDWQLRSEHRPRAMRRWPSNTGPEALVRLPDGRFLVFAEGRGGGSASAVLLFASDPAMEGEEPQRLSFRPAPGFRVTDAALLPDGRVMVLQRRFRLIAGGAARLSVIDPDAIGANGELEGRLLAEIARPLTIDNMEALSVAREDGRILVRLASDDNYMSMQRSLLLEFELVTD